MFLGWIALGLLLAHDVDGGVVTATDATVIAEALSGRGLSKTVSQYGRDPIVLALATRDTPRRVAAEINAGRLTGARLWQLDVAVARYADSLGSEVALKVSLGRGVAHSLIVLLAAEAGLGECGSLEALGRLRLGADGDHAEDVEDAFARLLVERPRSPLTAGSHLGRSGVGMFEP